jgi:polygalacturonase
MKALQNFLLVFFLFLFIVPMDAKTYNILDFGAVADTSIICTKAIQNAIDICNTNGGGVVVVPAGQFKTGTIVLKSHVNLFLEPGAVLYGSKNLGDYLKLKPGYVSLRTQEATIQLIYAENCENVSITGYGEINGQGSTFKKLSWNDEGITRPHLLRFIGCSNVLVENITLKNSGCWMQHYLACEKLQIRGVRVFNRNNFNNDGLDIDGCKNVTVSDFISDSDDDGITLKSTSPRKCENIVITNCVVSSHCNAIKLGTESTGGYKNIVISNCVVHPSENQDTVYYGSKNGTSGISLEVVDGGSLEDVSISNIHIEGTQSPLFIRLGNRARPYKKGIEVNNIGILRGISISSVRIKNAKGFGCSITGQPGFPVENIRLSNICMEMEGGCTVDSTHKKIAEKPKDYPEATMFGMLPAYGFYIRHARNITFAGLEITNRKDDARPAFFFDDVCLAELYSTKLSSSQNNEANIWLNQSSDILIQGNSVAGDSKCFVKIVGDRSSNISIRNNSLGNIHKIYEKEKGISCKIRK